MCRSIFDIPDKTRKHHSMSREWMSCRWSYIALFAYIAQWLGDGWYLYLARRYHEGWEAYSTICSRSQWLLCPDRPPALARHSSFAWDITPILTQYAKCQQLNFWPSGRANLVTIDLYYIISIVLQKCKRASMTRDFRNKISQRIIVLKMTGPMYSFQ